MTEPKGSTVIPADRIEIAIGWQFHQLAFDSQSNRLETKLLSAVTRIDWWTDRPSETVFRVEKSEVSDLSRPGGNESRLRRGLPERDRQEHRNAYQLPDFHLVRR
jgi:hypothetical protein